MGATFKPILWKAIVAGYRLLPPKVRKSLLFDTASDLGISSFQCSGPLGPFFGSPHDHAVFRSYAVEQWWEPGVRDEIRAHLPSGGSYVDIGANIGLTVVPVAQDPSIRCHAFEPVPRNFRFLELNVAENARHGNVALHNVALHEADGSLEMELSPDNYGDHRVRGAADGLPRLYDEEGRETISVPARRLDGLLDPDSLPRPLFVKLDVQGAEVSVLRGATALLPRVDFLLFEFWPYGLARAGASAEELIAMVGAFASGKVLEEGGKGAPFRPIGEILERMRGVSGPEHYPKHLDILVSRREPPLGGGRP